MSESKSRPPRSIPPTPCAPSSTSTPVTSESCTPKRDKPPRWQLLLATALGVAHAFTFAPWGNGWLQLAVLGGFGWLLANASARGAGIRRMALTGALFGLGWFTAGVGWLYIAMHRFGGLPAPLSATGVLLFAGYLSIFPALAAAVLGRFGNPRRPFGFMLLMAGALTLAELSRGSILSGFPWLGIGYAHIDSPLASLAPVGGVYAVTLAASLIGGCIAMAFHRLRPWHIIPGLAVIAVADSLDGMQWTHGHGQPITVSLLQGNVPQQMKFDPVFSARARADYLQMIESSPADLVLLPETAWTIPWQNTDPDGLARILSFVAETGSAVALGIPRLVQNPDPAPNDPWKGMQFTNSVMLLDRTGLADDIEPLYYDKRHLVPFGEFIPPGFRWFVEMMEIPLGDLRRGPVNQAPLPVADQRIGFNICYEDIFGEELLPVLHGTDGGDQDSATILANLTNLGWYGQSHALPQHLQIARMRALETGRPMIRSTNNGVTAVILPNGEVDRQLPMHEAGVLKATVQGHGGLTPYAQAGGNWPIWLASAAMMLLGMTLGRRRK
ncbi:MAG: apolipoprotein N-acyltransferase [Lautropia sp.]|nr:apolipoprotein N-acyltransferase [Lautropia sp.]